MLSPIAIFWFRRDLRLNDNHGLFRALKSGLPVVPLFIFDRNILDKLPNKHDLRLQFIHQEINKIDQELKLAGSGLWVQTGHPEEVFKTILETHLVTEIYCNNDYEPEAIHRDRRIADLVQKKGGKFYGFKDQCIFEGNEILKDNETPYTIFTPYSKKWKSLLKVTDAFVHYNSLNLLKNLHQSFQFEPIPSIEKLGFIEQEFVFPEISVQPKLIKEYQEKRNFPAISGTSRIGIHLRFGTISIREQGKKALELSETFLNELIWRDFYMQILYHFPHVATGAFKPAYNQIEWLNNPIEFDMWCKGKTGYPLVDAGMRELATTGFMHNRVRMVVASFLCKHLLIDWRLGEAWFAEKLLDFDLSANNGGWQWAAGSGNDAAPYFRIFNPALQTEKFDKQLNYIKKLVPEYGTTNYPEPIVNHEFARNRCLQVYKKALNS